jgi:hypothetical protein
MAFTDGRSGRRWRRRCRGPSVRRGPGPAPKLGAYRQIIEAWLEADRDAPRRQPHTAKRIWRRLVDEHGADVAKTTVRDYVRARKRQIGWPVAEVFVSQVLEARYGRGARRTRAASRPDSASRRSHTAAACTRSSPPKGLPVRSSQMTTTITAAV